MRWTHASAGTELSCMFALLPIGKTGMAAACGSWLPTPAMAFRPRSARKYSSPFSTKQDVGTGLGLWITKKLIENYGGRIRVRSSQVEGPRGTTFSMFFPKQVASQFGLAA